MAGLNHCTFIGNLGADPETRYTQTGTAVTSMSIACNETWKDKEGQKQERTEWVKCVFWGKLAEIAAQYLKKGSQAYIAGRLETQKWQDRNGNDRYTTQVVVRDMIMLGGGGARPPNKVNDYADAKAGEKLGPPPAATPQEPFDDDIPF